ncbi:MAG: RNA-binding protein 39 [Paramarteilia canceri]
MVLDDWTSSVLERQYDERRSKKRHSSSSSKKRSHRRSRSRSPRREKSSRDHRKEVEEELAPEERDVRTVMCLNLSNKISEGTLKEFMKGCGRIRGVKIIRDPNTGKSKGIAYVEFREIESVNKACDMTGKKLLGHSIIVETSQAEKNREYAAQSAHVKAVSTSGGKKIRVQNVHKNLDAEMLKNVFKTFGSITNCVISRDDTARNSTKVAYITFVNSSAAKNCAVNMDGFELADFKLKVTQLAETNSYTDRSILDTEIVDRGGINLGRSGRHELMMKLAEGSGLKIPEYPNNNHRNSDLNGVENSDETSKVQIMSNMPTQCLVISNFFDGNKSISSKEAIKIKDEVIEQCNKHGGCYHVSVDDSSLDGNVYLKCHTVGTANACFSTFDGKSYNNRTLAAAYLPIPTYHALFPEAANSYILLSTSQNLRLTA